MTVTIPALLSTQDPKALALLRANEQALIALRSLSAECLTQVKSSSAPGKLALPNQTTWSVILATRPHFLRYSRWELKQGSTTGRPNRLPDLLWVINEKSTFLQQGTTYRSIPTTAHLSNPSESEPWDGLFSPNTSPYALIRQLHQAKQETEIRYLGKDNVEGLVCDTVSFKYQIHQEQDRITLTTTLYLGPDALVRRKVMEVTTTNQLSFTSDSVVRNLKKNGVRPAPSLFAYSPPKGVTKFVEPARLALLATGTTAPDFSIRMADGKSVRLSDFRGKVVVLDFWATWCGPCMAAMPGTNRVAQKYQNKNVVVLGINVWDEQGKFESWLREKAKTFDAIQFALDPHSREDKSGESTSTLYRVSGIPTQYVISPAGKILGSFLGADLSTLPLEAVIERALNEAPQ